MSTQLPREFLISKRMFNNQDIDIIDGKTERLKVGETVHVIEYSAYEALKFPLSDASKQVYKRSFKSIDECQDFYCGYAIKIKEELESEREKLATVVARSEYVYQKAIDVQLSMPRQKLIKMEFSDLEDLRQLGAAIEDMGRTIAAIKGSK